VTSGGDGEQHASERPESRGSVGRTERAPWAVVAVLLVLAVILVLAADGLGMISR
jgi:hypothetical protein